MNESMLINTASLEKAQRQLDEARNAVNDRQHTDFWQQCVRDTSGKWVGYVGNKTRRGVNFFRGKQTALDYNDPDQIKYMIANIDTREAFYTGLTEVPSMSNARFRAWLESLWNIIVYRPIVASVDRSPDHAFIINTEVIPIAKSYDDPYYLGHATGPKFPGIPKNMLPSDSKQDDHIYHHYPSLEHGDAYLAEAHATLKSLFDMGHDDRTQYIQSVAYFYQLLINLHYFSAVNSSLYMNMANGLLEVAGIDGIEHGIVDFVALRLQPENFQSYFYDLTTK